MTNMQKDDSYSEKGLKAKVRMDFKGTAKSGRFLFGGKPVERVAVENRDQQVAVLKNVPIQGIRIETINMDIEIYTVYDEVLNSDVAYAPLELLISADSLEDLLRFITRDDFRLIEIIEPPAIKLTCYDIERLLFRVSEEMTKYKQTLERKYNR